MNSPLRILLHSFLALVFIFSSINTAKASHNVAVDLTYTCVDPATNTYRFRLVFYRDCGGVSAPTSVNLSVNNSCGIPNSNIVLQTLTQPPSSPTEVSQLCNLATSECNGGSGPGIEEYVYEGTGTLPPGCNSITLSYSLCCRTGDITNLSGASGLSTYIETVINTAHPQWQNPCNDSPQFTNIPVLYTCAGQNTVYSPGVIDPNGDSLVFSLVTPLTAAGTPVTYNAGFNANQPLCTTGPITLDPTSGQLTFTPCAAQSQYAIIGVLVEEYRNGMLIGTTRREIAIVVQPNCSNLSPAVDTINPVNGTITIAGQNVEVCRGETINFSVQITDPNPGDTLSVSSNIGLAPISGSLDSVVGATSPVTAYFTVNASNLLPGNYPFTITVNDGACPVPSVQTLGYLLTVTGFAYSQQVYCRNDTNPSPVIFGTSGGTFNVVTGGPGLVINPTTGIIDLQASSSGTYEVVYNVTNNPCPFTDSVSVTITDIPNPSFNYPQTLYCRGNVNPFPNVLGTPGGQFSSTTGVQFIDPFTGQIDLANSTIGSHIIYYDIQAGICAATDSFVLNITNLASFEANADDLFICPNEIDTINLTGTPNYSAGGLAPANPTYTWTDSTNLSSGSGATTTAYLLLPETFYAEYDDGLCPVQYDTVTITAPYPAVLDPLADVTLCQGTGVQIGANAFIQPGNSNGYTNSNPTTITAPVLPATTDTTRSTINVTGVVPAVLTLANIQSMQLCMNVNLNQVNQLQAFLTSPCGQTIELFPSGTAGNNTVFSNICFTPTAAGIMNVPPFVSIAPNSTFQSWGGFGGFAGCDANGDWELMFIHTRNASLGGSNGTLIDWTLFFNDPSTPTFTWDPNYNISCIVCDSPTVSPTVDTQYTVFLENLFGCRDTGTLNVFVDTALPAPIVVCDTLTRSSVQFSWNLIGNISNYEISIDSAAPFLVSNTTTSYTVTGLAEGQCVDINIRALGGPGLCPDGPITNHVCCALTCPPPGPVNILPGGSPTICAGESITLDAGAGGTAYLWDTGDPTQTISVNTSGTYRVTVTQTTGCIDTGSITVNVATPPVPTITPAGPTTLCNGQSVDLDAGAGFSNYTWFPNGNTQVITATFNLQYKVTVTDANGCTGQDSITVTIAPPVSTIIDTSINVSCFGAGDGSATALASGGYGGFTYAWDDASSQNNITMSNVPGGIYNVTATDINGCNSTARVTISEPSELRLNTSTTPSTCNGAGDGTAQVSINGGQPNYSILWDDGTTTALNASLPAGIYFVTVTDQNGCSAVATDTVGQPSNLSATVSITSDYNGQDISCNGACDAEMTVVASGGSPFFATGYDYVWTDGQTTDIATGLCAGNFAVTVTDSLGCFVILGDSITEPALLDMTLDTAIDVSCNGGADGTATVTLAGGTGPFTFGWDDPLAQSTATATGLTANTYMVTVGDVNGCSDTLVVVISEPSAVTVTTAVSSNFNGQDVSCAGSSDGEATATASGGTAGYTYLWDDPSAQTSAIATGLAAGVYCVTTTDANGCTATSCVTLTEPSAVTATASNTNVSCFGGSDGTATGVGAGGTGGVYTFLWDNGETTANITGLPAGPICVTVTDVNGCTDVACVTVTEPATAVAVTNAVTSNFNGQDVSCNGACDGEATATPAGGTPGTTGYTFIWDDPATQTTAIATGLCAGTYNVTVTDSLGCTSTAGITLTEPSAVTATIPASTDVSCNGGSDGDATAAGAGGTAPYTFNWDDPATQTTATATGLIAGVYNVTVTDDNGCNTTASVTITEPTAVTVTNAVTSNYNGADVSCAGSSDGEATATASGGTAGYTYLWDDPSAQTSAIATGLAAGVYCVTTTDANGCTATSCVTLTEPSAVTATASNTNVSCFGGSDGTATAVGAGGTGATYTFQWDDGNNQTTATATGLAANTYNVTVSDINGCNDVTTVTVTEPATAVSVTNAVTSNFNGQDVSCNGACDGEATATPAGGTPGTTGYTFIWDDPSAQTTAIATGLCAGTYNVTVTDSLGCTSTAGITLTEPSAVTATIPTSTDVSCNGGSDGDATAAGTGGTAPYTFSWDDLNTQTTATATGLTAGVYNVTVTDDNGCNTTASVTITEPTAVTVTNAVTSNYNGADVSCAGSSDGEATATASGGTAGYTYLWDDPSAQTSAIATGLAAGVYCVTTTDANGCTATSWVTLTEPSAVTATASNTNVSCFGGSDGTATGVGAGGTGAVYTFLWDNGETTANITGLPAGPICVTVTDANGCTDIACVTVTEPATAVSVTNAVTSNFNGQDVSCNGACDGEATATPAGGTPGTTGYTFIWDDPLAQTTAIATGLCAGTYNVTVTDSLGCTSTAGITLTEPSAVTATVPSTTPVSCNGGSDGTATVSGTGGTAPYTFTWDNGQTTITATGLPAGQACVTVTDVNGCTDVACVTITEPTAVSVTAAVTSNYNGSEISCNGASDGELTATGVGGTGTITYVWDDPSTQATAVANGLAAGGYCVTATDANGCTATTCITITEPSAVTATANNTDVSCFGGNDGTATASGAGGTGATYTFQWDDGNNQTTATATGLAANTYNVTVADVNGCTDVTTVTVTQPATAVSATTAVTSNYNGQDVSCNGACDGEATVTPAGGTAGYTFLWDDPSAQTTAIANGLCAGSYSVTVTDNLGCTTIATVTLTEPSAVTASVPSNTPVSCNGGSDGTATAAGAGGTAPYTFIWDNGETTATATGLPAGQACVTVSDDNGCSSVACVTITEPTALNNVTFTATTISCNGLTDGTATVSVSGGTPAYTYLWDNGQNTQTGTGFPAGPHTVTITDANGCTITGTVTITEPSALSVTVVTDSVNCFGGSDGSATATPAGGTAPYSYLWSTGANTFEITNQPAGPYTVTITDGNGCQITQTVDIGEPASILTVNILSSTNPVCSGDTDGTITADALGGTPGYTFAWDVGQFTATATGLGAGTYTVTVTDARGCTASTTATLTTPTPLITNVTQYSNFNGAAISCPGATDGAAQVTASGGVPGYTYLWSGPVTQNTTIASGLAQGTYFVTVTDAAGCSAVDSITLTDPVPLQATETHTDVFCNGDCDGQIIVNAVSGTGTLGINGYEYRIVGPGQTGNVFSSNNNFLGLCAGTYTVEVRDGNNCVLPVSITLTEPPVLAASATGTDASCNGAADGTATVTATGGVAPYSYSWPGGLSGNPVTGLAAGGYDVTVTDANGCDVVTSVVINEPTALTATVTFTEPSCNNGGNATATATPSGGTAPYSYFWSNGQNGQTAIGYTAGTHTVTISDANNCQIVRNVTITQPAALTVSITGTNLNCSGNGSGTATATPTGGTGPYTYQWSNNQTTQTATGLSQGVVSVIVTDANNCQALATTTLTQPNPLQVSLVSTTNATCNGAADGSATVTASGGSAPYTYNWSNGQAGATATGLTAGIYTASVTDNGGCTQTIQVNITEPNAISIDQINTTMVSCKGGSDGTASAFISGGTAPYTFSWTGGGNTQQLTGLTAGTYNLTLTDANGCSTTSTVIVNEPAQALTGVINTQGTLCSGGATGQLTAVISGGTLTSPDYNYQWSNGATTPVVSGVTAGTYSVTVTDDNGCTLSLSATVGSGGTIAINSLTNTDVTCEGGSDATANVAASGGAGTLVYNWSNGQAGTVATGLSAGTYYISITDDNGCTYVDSVTVQDGPEITINTNISDANCFGESSGTLTVTNAANFGSISWNDPQLQVGAQASNLAAGQYTVTVVTLAGCPATETYTVGQPDELVTNIEELSPVACRDDSTGSLRGTASGGTGAYSFSWSTGGNNATINNLPAGAYSLSITDANGCQEVESYSFGNPVALGLEASGTGVACVGDNDGNIQVSGVGGTARLGSYEFSLDSSNWQAGNLFPNLTSGVYTVYVRDNNGCVADTMVNIEAADPFFIISLLPGDTTIEYGDTIVLEADVNDPTGAVVNWIDVNAQDTIVDSTSTSAYIITQFPAERTIYRFVAVSPAGCVADTSMIVDVNKTRVVGAPSAFTPNLDGANDRFFIQAAESKIAEQGVKVFRVYDRWGELVFERTNVNPNDPLQGWDGSFHGKPMNSGVFVWYAEVEFIDGHVEVIQGEVTLLK